MFKGFTKQRSEKKNYYADGLINIPGVELLLADNKKDNYLLAWKYNAKENHIRELKFLINNKIVKRKFTIPPTYYIAKGNHFEIYCGYDAVKGLMLYQLPFPNMTGLGTVCFGNIDIKIPKEASYSELIGLWMGWYWNSTFAPNDSDKQILKIVNEKTSMPASISAMKKVRIEKTLEQLIEPHLL